MTPQGVLTHKLCPAQSTFEIRLELRLFAHRRIGSRARCLLSSLICRDGVTAWRRCRLAIGWRCPGGPVPPIDVIGQRVAGLRGVVAVGAGQAFVYQAMLYYGSELLTR